MLSNTFTAAIFNDAYFLFSPQINGVLLLLLLQSGTPIIPQNCVFFSANKSTFMKARIELIMLRFDTENFSCEKEGFKSYKCALVFSARIQRYFSFEIYLTLLSWSPKYDKQAKYLELLTSGGIYILPHTYSYSDSYFTEMCVRSKVFVFCLRILLGYLAIFALLQFYTTDCVIIYAKHDHFPRNCEELERQTCYYIGPSSNLSLIDMHA